MDAFVNLPRDLLEHIYVFALSDAYRREECAKALFREWCRSPETKRAVAATGRMDVLSDTWRYLKGTHPVTAALSRLDNLAGERSAPQRLMCDSFLEAFVNQSPRGAHVMAPRRFGKTQSIERFCAALIFAREGASAVVISPGERSATATLRKVLEYSAMLGAEAAARERFASIPADVANTIENRGAIAAADVIIMDEASNFLEDIFTGVIVPLFGEANAVFLGASTPKGPAHPYTAMMSALRPEGEGHVFNVVRIGYTA